MPNSQATAALIRHFAESVSFGILSGERKPGVSVAVDLQVGGVEGTPELRMHLKIEAAGQYLLDLSYCGAFELINVPEKALPRLLLIDAPQMLFPFIQKLASDAVANAGFGFLALEAIDFAKLYQSRKGAVPDPVDVRFVAPPARIRALFPSHLYHATLGVDLAGALEKACLNLAASDDAGKSWAKANAYSGYTSYASISDLTARAPAFAELARLLDSHVAAFSEAAEFDMRGKRLVLSTIWANVMEEGGLHTSHIHPHSAISGTYYVATPEGAAAICFEDPRSGLMMSAPPRHAEARTENRAYVQIRPQAGSVLLWESWLRHGVEMQHGTAPRISISFNYRVETI